MGPLFSLLLIVMLMAAYSLFAYVILRLYPRHNPSAGNVAVFVLTGAIGAGLAVVGTSPLWSGETLESSIEVMGYLSVVSMGAVGFSFLGLKLVAKLKTKSNPYKASTCQGINVS
jgi:hypothetical protein